MTGATQYSAYPPPFVSAQTLLPISQAVASTPASTTSPATSRPMMGLAPGGAGYCPLRWATSGRLTPAACTRISTSSARGRGTSVVEMASTSGPPAVGGSDEAHLLGNHRNLRLRPDDLTAPRCASSADRIRTGSQAIYASDSGSHASALLHSAQAYRVPAMARRCFDVVNRCGGNRSGKSSGAGCVNRCCSYRKNGSATARAGRFHA